MRFDSASVMVTGAGSGIGRATAQRVAAEGAAVSCVDQNAEAARATATELLGQGGTAVAITADVRDRAQLARAVALVVDRFGRLTHLVNCAGVLGMAALSTLTDEEWQFVLDVNVKGTFLAVQAAAPAIAASGGGAIVNITSVEANVVVATGPTCQPHYSASKGATKALTKALAHELARSGIRVNAVAPGPVSTPMLGGRDREPAAKRIFEERMLIPRAAQPREIAAAIAFLLSNDASYITGVEMPVDGGWLVH